ncbi:hypothetical protein [Chryseobacterium arthrosphaerae]|uniref:Uncharacterized protein n=1 Tax=Chryseobacterium arthrosphaerae TaxID=651561 RepID=A0A1B8ZJD1_9FLAO|nr:hypothetical protein [Chryseobacterium arthrosphaerae]OCA71711.1 hypothetical protein BBI00_18610 [Chryseobacterium arthrosphaerae]
MSTKNLKLTADHIDWSKMKVYEQSETGIKTDNILSETKGNFNKGFPGVNHQQLNELIKTDPPVTDNNLMKAADAPGMINKFYTCVSDSYEKRFLITETVLKDIFNNVNEAYIFLGEIENEGLIFMWQDSKEDQYYIVNNCDSKISITEQEFLDHKEFYARNLKGILDTYIPEGDPNPGNTKRFIVRDGVYQEFLRQSAKEPLLTFVVSFYPAMHLINEIYYNRLTFIMVVEKYVDGELKPADDTALYDRNGLCPPGNC